MTSDGEGEYRYTLHKFTEMENCEADSLPDLNFLGWCGKETMYYVKGNCLEIALCKDHRTQLRLMGLVK